MNKFRDIIFMNSFSISILLEWLYDNIMNHNWLQNVQNLPTKNGMRTRELHQQLPCKKMFPLIVPVHALPHTKFNIIHVGFYM